MKLCNGMLYSGAIFAILYHIAWLKVASAWRHTIQADEQLWSEGAHIVRQLKAGLRLRGLNIAPGQAKRKNGGRHNATAWRCSLRNFPAVRASPRLGYLTSLSLAVVS